MPAYLIVDIEVKDPERYAEYVRVVPSTIEKYGGKYLVRGGRAEKLEGDWDPHRIVVLEFPDFDRAREWWSSEEYLEPKAFRQSIAVTNMILAQGMERVEG